MRKILVGFALILVVASIAYLHFRRSKSSLGYAYAGERQVTLYDGTAQVRSPVTTVSFGDRLEILQRSEDHVEVRAASGITGWTTEAELLSTDLWLQAKDLDDSSAKMPVEARGHTRVLANLHIAPGRDTVRIRQLTKGVPLELLTRQVGQVPATPGASQTDEAAGAPPEAKKEDWWLVRAEEPDQTTLAGWVLGRFIELDVPQPLPDYASSAGLRIVGWFELNRMKDSTGTARSQYLLLGARGPEGQPCDFTALRAFTWSNAHQRYETAFVESDVCGKLPVAFSRPAKPGGDLSFSFQNLGDPQPRLYVMRQTVIRRVRREGEMRPKSRKAAH
jgi:hypothetical protein